MASVLTFAYLRELQKKERTSRKLEKLPAEFYNTLSEYIARKGSQKDVESALPVIKYILERREQKVLELAAMSVSAGIDPENLLPEEKELFDAAQNILEAHRAVIANIFGQKSEAKEVHHKASKISETPVTGSNTKTEDAVKPEEKALDESKEQVSEEEKEKPQKVRLEVSKDIPSFIAEDLAAHGPWKQGDVVECPPKAAKVLVDNGLANYL